MKVQSLEISAFRGIDQLTLEFASDAPTVLIGVNGVGKSSILDCLAILLSFFIEKLVHHDLIPWTGNKKRDVEYDLPLTTDDIKNGNENSKITINVYKNRQNKIWSKTIWRRRASQLEPASMSLSGFVPSHDSKCLPVIVYYPVNRAIFNASLDIANEDLYEPLDAYDDSLVNTSINFNTFFQWFRGVEDLENEERRDNSEYRDKNLEAVRQAILLLIPGFENLRVRRSPLRMTVNKNGEELIVNQLSDGEKCLLAMVGDLARRLAIANPALSDPLQGEGVVLIDEIELHLHPQWQREIIPALTRTFPNCQFIVTTHSPQIVSHVRPENVYVLQSTSDGIVAKHPSSSYGRDSNRILEDLMETPARPEPIKEEILELFRIIDRGDLEEAKKLRDRIIEKIGSDEPELVKADVLMRRKEILKR